MARPITNPGLNIRKIVSKNKHGRNLFMCKSWDCDNLTTGRVCAACNSKGKHRGLSRCSTPLSKRKARV